MYWASSSVMPRKMNWALQRRTQAVGDLSMKSGRSRYDDDDKVSAAVAACLLLLSPMLADDDDDKDGAAKEGLSKDSFPKSRAAGGSVRGCSAEGCSVAWLLSVVVDGSFFFRNLRPRWPLLELSDICVDGLKEEEVFRLAKKRGC